MKEVYTESAENNLGRKKNKPLKSFISEAVLQLTKEKCMKHTRTIKRKNIKKLKKEIRTKIIGDEKAGIENG